MVPPGSAGTSPLNAGPVPAGPRAVVRWPPRPRNRIAGIPVGLLVGWEVAGLLALVAAGRPAEQAVVIGFAATVVVAASMLRWRRRWSYEWVALWWRYRGRRRSIRAAFQAGGHGTPPGVGVIEWVMARSIAQAEALTEVELGAERAAVIEHAGGMSSVLEISGLSVDMLDLPISLLPPFDPDGPEFALQALLHVRPVPPANWAGGALLALEALRDPAWTRQHTQQALAGALGKLLDRLRRQGYATHPVDVDQTSQMLRVIAMLDLVPAVAGATPGRETWARWRARGVTHETLRLRSWSTPVPDVVRTVLTAMPAGTTVTLAARRAHRFSGYPGISETDRVVAAQLHIRVSEHDAKHLSAATKLLRRRLSAIGASVQRLDGRQAPGLAATLPLGGFVP
jgi:hypothetical protein